MWKVHFYPRNATLMLCLSQTPDFKIFASACQSSKRFIDEGGRSEHDKLDRRQSAKLTVPPTLDRCSLSQ